MSYLQNLSLFWLLILGIVIVPGMDMLFVLSNSLARGRRAGMAAVAGIVAAGAVHTAWGALAAALLFALPQAVFTAMLAAGGLYLGWVGLTLARSALTVGEGDTGLATRAAFRQGAITAMLNPKAYLFVGSVFPQFVRPEYGPIWRQALVVALLVAATQFAVYGGVAAAAGRIRRWLIASPGATIWTGRIIGALFLAIAAITIAGAFLR
jgi:threonine/homoserine/homoserine lactone efflux protein